MTNRSVSPAIEGLNRKFLPANICIFFIALVALIAQIFMPFFDLRITVHGENLFAYLEENISRSGDAQDETTESVISTLSESLQDVELQISINIYPLKTLKAGIGTDEDVAEFFNSLIGKKGVTAFVEEMVNALAKPILRASVTILIDQAVTNAELSPEEQALIEEHKEDIVLITDALFEGTPEKIAEAKGILLETVEDIASIQGETLTPEMREDISKAFDELIEQGTLENGNFDLMKMLKNFDIEALEKELSPKEETTAPASIKIATKDGAIYAEENVAETGETDNPFKEVFEILENPGKMILELLYDAGLDINIFKIILLGVFALTTAFPALLWLILTLSALIRCGCENKRVHTWYVKLFCIWGGVFVGLANLALSLLNKFLPAGEVMEILSIFSIKFLGSAVITGSACLLLILISLFYYNRVKKKIKMEKKRFLKGDKRTSIMLY